ncbi:MAG: TonB-dependent receptor [Anaeromyxobacteraceae bacterium]
MLRSRTFAAAVALVLAGTAYAQVSTATIKGMITSGDTVAPAGTAVVAVNKASGFTYRTTTQADGGYVLTSLPPGNYEIRITAADGVAKTEAITLAVGETASVDFSMGGKSAEKVEEIVVTGTTRRKAVKTSEVGTVVSQKMAQAMPVATRNFLAGAELAPGVAYLVDEGTGYTKLQAGAADRNNSNVFIDGISQKNNIIRGGASGQDSSRGNPFPQSAIAEYKVLTQNYKAEYDQVSSAAITAVTKSGGNELHGDAYFDRFETRWRSQSPLERNNARNGLTLPFSSKNEAGVSVGGPIKEDAINYFLAYDYKNIDDSRTVAMGQKDKYDPNKGIVPDLLSKTGAFVDPFQEHLVFGKVSARLGENRTVWASVRTRFEADNVPEDRTWSARGNNKDRANNDFRFDAVHEWNYSSDLVSETKLSYQYALWNPHSAASEPLMKYLYSPTNSINSVSGNVLYDGGSPDNQKRAQSGFTLAQDVTFTGVRSNVIKGGLKASLLNYALSGTSRSVDVVRTILDPATGLPFFDGTNCTGNNVTNNGANSDQCQIDRALAPAGVSLDNAQFGLYAQDDWAVTSRLEVNIGARWDYETNMLNNSYVTPADRVAAIYAPDVARWGITPPAGQTYAESLAKGGVNIGDYISDGKSRKSFAGAIAPRVGASYDLFGDRNTVFFGGWGRSYDRAMANHALDEKQKNAQAGGEISAHPERSQDAVRRPGEPRHPAGHRVRERRGVGEPDQRQEPVPVVLGQPRRERRLGHPAGVRPALGRPQRLRLPHPRRHGRRDPHPQPPPPGREAVLRGLPLDREHRLHALRPEDEAPRLERRHLRLELRQDEPGLERLHAHRQAPHRRGRHGRPARRRPARRPVDLGLRPHPPPRGLPEHGLRRVLLGSAELRAGRRRPPEDLQGRPGRLRPPRGRPERPQQGELRLRDQRLGRRPARRRRPGEPLRPRQPVGRHPDGDARPDADGEAHRDVQLLV